MSDESQAAIFTELSLTTKPMAKDWNTRVFNYRDYPAGDDPDPDGIDLDRSSGIITLGPGFYQISGFSAVTYYDVPSDPTGKVPTNPTPYGGYCRLRHASDTDCPNEQAISVGSVGNANMLPSLFETYLRLGRGENAEILLEHQVGANADKIALQVYTELPKPSKWHVFARISIRRLSM